MDMVHVGHGENGETTFLLKWLKHYELILGDRTLTGSSQKNVKLPIQSVALKSE